MPYTRSRRPRGRRLRRTRRVSKYGRRRYQRGRPKLTIGRSLGIIMPDRLNVKLNYNDLYNATITTGAANVHQYRGNSIFDPDFTGTGDTALGHAQWSAFYKDYVVTACRISFKIVPSNPNDVNLPLMYACWPEDSAGVPADIDDLTNYMNQPYARWNIFVPSGGPNNKCVSMLMPTNKIFGVPRHAITSDDEYSASIDANPTKAWIWNIAINVSNVETTPSSTAPTVVVRLRYYVSYFNRKELIQQ